MLQVLWVLLKLFLLSLLYQRGRARTRARTESKTDCVSKHIVFTYF